MSALAVIGVAAIIAYAVADLRFVDTCITYDTNTGECARQMTVEEMVAHIRKEKS